MSHLFATVRWQVKSEHGEEGYAHTGNDEIDSIK